MVVKIFSIYDNQAMAYTMPVFQGTKGIALRAFMEACNDPSTAFHKHPDDFALFELGEFDDATGDFSQPKKPEPVATAREMISRAAPRPSAPESRINSVPSFTQEQLSKPHTIDPETGRVIPQETN